MTTNTRIGLVWQDDIGRALLGLRDCRHIWIADSEANRLSATALLRDGDAALTWFKKEGDDEIEDIVEVVGLIEDHHGEFSGDGEIDDVLEFHVFLNGEAQVSGDQVAEWIRSQLLAIMQERKSSR